MDKFISIQEASIIIGVTTTALRRLEKFGLLKPHHRTLGNHRRYDLQEILKLYNPEKELKIKKTVCYSRVSTYD